MNKIKKTQMNKSSMIQIISSRKANSNNKRDK